MSTIAFQLTNRQRRRLAIVIPAVVLILSMLACGSSRVATAPQTYNRQAEPVQSAAVPPAGNQTDPAAAVAPTSIPATAEPIVAVATPTALQPEPTVTMGQQSVEYNYLTTVGEVSNPASIPIEYVEVIAMFYDQSGNMVDTDSTYTLLDVIGPGASSPFRLSVAASPDKQIASTKLQVQYRYADELPYGSLTANVANTTQEYGYVHLVGEAKNEGDRNCQYFKVIAGIYDQNKKLLYVDEAYTELDTVAAGGSSPFKLSAPQKAIAGASVYRLWYQCRPE